MGITKTLDIVVQQIKLLEETIEQRHFNGETIDPDWLIVKLETIRRTCGRSVADIQAELQKG